MKLGVSNMLSSHSEVKCIVPLRGAEIDIPPDLLTDTEGGEFSPIAILIVE